MNEFTIEKLKKLIAEILKEGYGEVNFKVVVKNSKIEYVSLTKTNTFHIDNFIRKD